MTRYLRDMSFENPGMPYGFTPGSSPATRLGVTVNVRKMRNVPRYETGLKLRLEIDEDKTRRLLAEIEYCGLFEVVGVADDAVLEVLSTEGAAHLFPFARRILAAVTEDGGYFPIVVDPLDFKDIFRRRVEMASKRKAEREALESAPGNEDGKAASDASDGKGRADSGDGSENKKEVRNGGSGNGAGTGLGNRKKGSTPSS